MKNILIFKSLSKAVSVIYVLLSTAQDKTSKAKTSHTETTILTFLPFTISYIPHRAVFAGVGS